MRRTFIVTYDIREPKRLRKVHRACKNHGTHLQYSVFECDLDEAEKARFEDELRGLIHHRNDQVLFIDLGPLASRGERTVSALGQTYVRVDPPAFVI